MGRQFKPGQLQTGSLYNISSSYAITSSYALTAQTLLGSVVSASYAETASFAPNYVLTTATSSMLAPYVLISNTSSMSVLSSSFSSTASYVQLAQTASYVLQAVSASVATNAISSSFSNTASYSTYAVSSSHAITASYFNETDPIFVAKSGSFATTGSNVFKASQTIFGNLFMSGSFRLIYNNDVTNNMLFGMFDGSSIYGPYYQLFGNQYSNLSQRGSAEFVYDTRNGGDSGFNVASYNGFAWTRRFRVSDTGIDVNGSATITGSLLFDNGTSLVPNLYGSGGLDIVAEPAGYVELISNNTQSRMWVDDNGVYVGTNWDTNPYQWTFSDTGYFTLPQVTSLTTQAGILTTGDLLLQADSTQGWRFSSGSGILYAPGGIEAPSFTGSLFGTASWSQNANTASYSLNSLSASYAMSADTASNILGGSINHVPYFKTNTTLATSSIYQSGSSTVIINQDNATSAYPEALYVWQPSTSSFNVISGKGNLNNYLQLNIQNTNQGPIASSDVVATANNGNETTNYVDMGINSENYTGVLGGPNDAYLYSTGIHLHIGNATPNQYVGFFAGGDDVDANMKMILDANDQHQITGSLELTDRVKAPSFTGSLLGTASYSTAALTASHALYSADSNLLDGKDSSTFATTGSNTFIGNQTVTGSLFTTGSNTLIGITQLTGSLNVSGSQKIKGYVEFDPVTTNIDTSLSASYIYVSGSTNDLYFTQNGNGYANTTRLRWLEGNLYTGLLNGGLITTASSTTFNISSGSGIIVNLNASLTDNPYPTIQYINWNNLTNQSLTYRTSSIQTFVGIDSAGQIIQQTTPWTNGQYNTSIAIGTVLHQNLSTINANITYPNVAYGYKQRTYDFIKAFGPLKLSGLVISPSSSLGLTIGSGTAFADGRNYQVDPNNPSYIIDPGTTVSKIFRYYQSGSGFVQDTNAGAGYTVIDPANYNNNGTLTGVSPSTPFTIQRVFWYPNSATKGIVVYYGNAQYASIADAAANLNFETFNEVENTKQNAVYLGAVIIKYNGVFTNPTDYSILPAGIFRSVGGSGGGSAVSTTLATLGDVTIAGPTNGQPLVYNSSLTKWQNSSTVVANLTGNASTATSASHATTASYSETAVSSSYAVTASYALNGGSGGSAFPYTGSAIITGSLIVTGSITSTEGFTGSLFGTSTSSSYATTASYASVAQTLLGSVVTAETASYATNFTVGSTLNIDGTLFDRSTVASTIVGSNNLFTQATGSYTAAFGKYTLHNGSNARAGEFNTVWNGTTAVSTETSTTDIGNTADITFASSIVTGNIQINTVAATSGWTVKMLITYI
jgi:hypothetical protein